MPHLFHFREDETFRDVILTVEAPDLLGVREVFNINARQAGLPIGGATITVTHEELH